MRKLSKDDEIKISNLADLTNVFFNLDKTLEIKFKFNEDGADYDNNNIIHDYFRAYYDSVFDYLSKYFDDDNYYGPNNYYLNNGYLKYIKDVFDTKQIDFIIEKVEKDEKLIYFYILIKPKVVFSKVLIYNNDN